MAKKILNLDTDSGVESWRNNVALDVNLDTTNFNKNLDTNVTDVQKLADKVDDLVLGGLPSGTANQTLRHNGTAWVGNNILTVFTDKVNISGGLSCNTSTQAIRIWGNDVMFGQYGNTASIGFSGGNTSITGNNSVDIRSNRTGGTTYGFVRISSYLSGTSGAYISMQGDINSFVNISKTLTRTVKVTDLQGTGTRNLVALEDGTIAVGDGGATQIQSDWNQTDTNAVDYIKNKPTINQRNYTEYESGFLTGTEHIFTGTTLGISGDLRTKIKNIKCFGVDIIGDLNGALIAYEFIYETEVTVFTAINLSGSFKIKLFIEYID